MRLLILSLLLCAAPALAGDPIETPDEKPAEVRYKAITDIVIDDVRVDGGIQKPTGIVNWELRRNTFNPLVKLRSDFDDQMVESVQQVR